MASSKDDTQELLGVALCSAEVEELPADIQLHRAQATAQFQTDKKQKYFHGDHFVRLAGTHMIGVWSIIEKASQVDIRLAEMEHPSLKKALSYCSGWVPIYVHPTFYRSLKLNYPLDVRGLSRDSQVTIELGTGSLRHAVGVLTPEDFCVVVNSE